MGSELVLNYPDQTATCIAFLCIGMRPNAILLASCRVAYSPLWGGFGRVSVIMGVFSREAAPGPVTIPHPRQGGVVLSAGPYVFEVILRHNGGAFARALSPHSGQKVSSVNLSLLVSTDTGLEPIALRWLSRRKRFFSGIPKRLRMRSGRLYLLVRDHTKRYVGGVRSATPQASPTLGGFMLSAGPYTVEISFRGSGALFARVLDLNQRAVSFGALQLTMYAHSKKGTFPVPINWSNQSMAFRGRLPLSRSMIAQVSVKVRVIEGIRNVQTAYDPEIYWLGAIALH